MRSRIRSERGEVASWLILGAGLALAAALAASVMGGTIGALANRVAEAATGGSVTGVVPGDSGVTTPVLPPGLEADGTFSDPALESTFGDIIDAIDNGDDLGMSNGELNDVRDLLAGLTPEERALVIARLTDKQLERIVHNLHSDSFWSNDYDDRERTEFYELLYDLPLEQKDRIGQFSPFMESFVAAERGVLGDPDAQAAFESLIYADTFTDGPDFDERTALLSADGNYPDPTSITNLEQLTTREWFTDLDLADTQRSAQSVAFLTQYTGGDQDVINNTLDQILADDSTIVLRWDDLGTSLFGTAGGGVITLNRDMLADGNGLVDISNASTERMLTHTVAHEVNHVVNNDTVSSSFEYFMGEYRAFYVGEQARYGTTPTAGQVRGRVSALLTATTGAYSNIADALGDPVQGPLIADFVSGIVGHEVTPENVVAELAAIDDASIDAPTPISVDGGPNNLDNS